MSIVSFLKSHTLSLVKTVAEKEGALQDQVFEKIYGELDKIAAKDFSSTVVKLAVTAGVSEAKKAGKFIDGQHDQLVDKIVSKIEEHLG